MPPRQCRRAMKLEIMLAEAVGRRHVVRQHRYAILAANRRAADRARSAASGSMTAESRVLARVVGQSRDFVLDCLPSDRLWHRTRLLTPTLVARDLWNELCHPQSQWRRDRHRESDRRTGRSSRAARRYRPTCPILRDLEQRRKLLLALVLRQGGRRAGRGVDPGRSSLARQAPEVSNRQLAVIVADCRGFPLPSRRGPRMHPVASVVVGPSGCTLNPTLPNVIASPGRRYGRLFFESLAVVKSAVARAEVTDVQSGFSDEQLRMAA